MLRSRKAHRAGVARIAGRPRTSIRSATRRDADAEPRAVEAIAGPKRIDTDWQARPQRPTGAALRAQPGEPLSPAERLVSALMRRVEFLDLSEVERVNGSMDAVAERMLASIPGTHALDERVGPFYDTAGLRKWFDMGRQTLQAQAKVGDVLCVVSSDGHRLYPSFQFDVQGSPLPRLREVLAALDPDRVDLWGDAVWLNTPATELDDRSPAQVLRSERAGDVIRLAERAGTFRLG
jgi:hypothetical protein